MWVVRMRSVLRFTALEAGGYVLDRVLEVRARAVAAALRVARHAGGEDLAVLGVQPLDREVGGGAVDVQIRARGVAQGGDHLDEPRPVAALVDAGVEALVELEVAPRGRGVAHLVEQQLERIGPVGLEALGRPAGGERLQRGADLVVLTQVVHGRNENHGAALRMQPHEALALQRAERLAHRRCADAEAARDLHLPQPAARRQASGDDLAP